MSVRFSSAAPPVLQDVDLTVRQGEFLGVVGATGSGKTTLLNVMAGVIPHYYPAVLSGEVRLFGQDTRTLSLRQIARRVGMVLQDPEAQLFNLIVRDELVWGLENRGLSRAEMSRRLEECLALFGIEHLRDRITYDLSGGEKQRVALAAVYAIKPDVMILDHPTSQLDPIGASRVMEAIGRLRATGDVTIVLADDNLEELLEQANRLVLVREGRIALDAGAREFATATAALADAGVRPSQVVQMGHLLRAAGAALDPLPITVSEALPAVRALAQERFFDAGEPPPLAPPPADRPVLEAQAVDVIYPPPRMHHAVRAASLQLRPGELAAIIGKNGSGKTSLARCMSGFLTPTAGRVLAAGHDIAKLRPRQRARLVGHVFQNPDHQLFRESVLDEVAFGLRLVGAPPEEAASTVERVLRLLALWEYRNEHPFALVKGHRQRLAIASIVVLNPGVLIVDEPTTGQDPERAREILTLLTDLAQEQRMAVVIISHAMELVAEYAQRTLVMCDGQVLLDAPTREAFAELDLLARASVTPPPVTRLGLEMGMNPPPLTVAEVRSRLQDLVAP